MGKEIVNAYMGEILLKKMDTKSKGLLWSTATLSARIVFGVLGGRNAPIYGEGEIVRSCDIASCGIWTYLALV